MDEAPKEDVILTARLNEDGDIVFDAVWLELPPACPWHKSHAVEPWTDESPGE